jgi:hypothetical protein
MRHRSHGLVLVTALAALAACSGDTADEGTGPAPAEIPAVTPEAPPVRPTAPPVEPEAPAPEPQDTATAEPADPAAAARGTAEELAEWKDHMGDVPYYVGYERGLPVAKEAGKPLLLFYTGHG